MKQPDYAARAFNVTSQHGEDGILKAIFAVLEVERGACVEFGAWDGRHFSNTYNLIANHGWGGVLIEANAERFAALRATHRGNSDVLPIRRTVNFDSPDTLDEILSGVDFPHDYDLLSIDIDGNDYHVLATLTRRPKVIVIEFNPSIPNDVAFVQPRDMACHHGSSLRSIDGLARSGGYALVATTVTNAIFTRWDLVPKLGITDHSLDMLHPDRSMQTVVFQLYDGTVVLAGVNELIWHPGHVPITLPQPLPEADRQFPED